MIYDPGDHAFYDLKDGQLLAKKMTEIHLSARQKNAVKREKLAFKSAMRQARKADKLNAKAKKETQEFRRMNKLARKAFTRMVKELKK